MARGGRGWRRIRQISWSSLLSLVFFVAVLALCLGGFRQIGAGEQEEALRVAEESIRRAAVTCYAVEGCYPESYEDLKERYAVRVDEEKYVVHYTIFASNMMPDIYVAKK